LIEFIHKTINALIEYIQKPINLMNADIKIVKLIER